jgi:hypothetical protein
MAELIVAQGAAGLRQELPSLPAGATYHGPAALLNCGKNMNPARNANNTNKRINLPVALISSSSISQLSTGLRRCDLNGN